MLFDKPVLLKKKKRKEEKTRKTREREKEREGQKIRGKKKKLIKTIFLAAICKKECMYLKQYGDYFETI